MTPAECLTADQRRRRCRTPAAKAGRVTGSGVSDVTAFGGGCGVGRSRPSTGSGRVGSPLVITPLSNEQMIGRWQEISRLAQGLRERVDTDGEFETPPGCAMAGDDSHLGDYQITTAFRMCLMAAADHLHALTSLVVELQRLHLAAPASLARGAIENGATAFWLIHPKSRDERIEHTLRWYAKDTWDQQRAVGDLGIGGTPAVEVIERLERLASDRQLDVRAATKAYTSTEVVEYAEKHVRSIHGDPLDHLLLRWRSCSGFAHGRAWAFLAALNSETVRETGPGTRQLRLTNSMDRALWAAEGGLRVIEAALRVHRDRTTSREGQ
jgi:hypothetical protein